MLPSISSINIIFHEPIWKKDLADLFEIKYLVRQIARSGLNKETKKCYLGYIRVLEKGFHSK